ncbi:MAG: hypothetical protein KDA77_08040 [Planctomycetaceae bacterium]|nr:hypothetical protein [Planctomycetaceae bacterium]
MTDEINETSLDKSNISLETMYVECSVSYRYHLDWRYKMLTRFFVVVSALVASAGWLFTNKNALLPNYSYAPFVVIVFTSLTFLVMSFRDKKIFDRHERLGARLEAMANKTGIYSELVNLGNWPLPYNFVVPLIYCVVGFVAFVLSIVLLVGQY